MATTDENTTALARVENSDQAALMAVSDVKYRMDCVIQLMTDVMRKGPDGDFGVIPGTGNKPTLLKPGAEKLCTLFRLAPQYKIDVSSLGGMHREYSITCVLTHIPTGKVWGEGAASCSTMESKYRWRNGGRKCPECGKEAIIKGKAEYGGGFICFAKKGGCGAKFSETDQAITKQEVGRVENPDVADAYNTVLKMGTKRALVAAVLIATGASALFTQDIEENLPDDRPIEAELVPQEKADPHRDAVNKIAETIQTGFPADPAGRKAAGAAIKQAFGATKWEVISALPLEELREGLRKLQEISQSQTKQPAASAA